MRKTNVLFLVLVVGMIVFCGISYAAVVGFINAATPDATGTAAKRVVEDTVRAEAQNPPTTPGETDKGKLGSNTTVTTRSLASGETLAEARPDLAEDMSKLLTINARSITTEATLNVAVAMINDAITNGKDVGITGLSDEELGKAVAALEGKVANLTDLKDKRILFIVVNNTVIDAIQLQFDHANGNFANATANLLAPVVQDALKGGV